MTEQITMIEKPKPIKQINELPFNHQDFLKLSEYFDELSRYTPREIQDLARDTVEEEDVPRSKKAMEEFKTERIRDLQEKVVVAIAQTTRALTALSLQDDVQKELQKVGNKEVGGYDKLVAHAQTLLEGFYMQFDKRCRVVECHRDPSGRRSQDVAWGMTSHIPQSEEQATKWNALIQELKRLPGPHRHALAAYEDDKNARTTLDLIRSYHLFQPSASRLELVYSKTDLDHLYALVRRSTAFSEHILEKFPLFEDVPPDIFVSASTQENVRPTVVATQEFPPRAEQVHYIEFGQEYRELKELFGTHFFGIEEIDRAGTIPRESQDVDSALDDFDRQGIGHYQHRNEPSEQHLFSFTPEQQRHALALLRQKIAEPDVAQFIAKIRARECGLQPEDFMLVLRRGEWADGTAVTMQSLQSKLEPTMVTQRQGRLLYNQDWYHTESFYTDPQHNLEARGNMEWVIVSKNLIPYTLRKTYSQQTKILEDTAKKWNLTTHRRRKPWEVVYDHLIMRRNGDQQIFGGDFLYDWTDVESADRGFVDVGYGASGGLDVSDWHPSGSGGGLGSSLSR